MSGIKGAVGVAPLVGAWIEIVSEGETSVSFSSLLSWERGLKSLLICGLIVYTESLLSWERGLKYAVTGADAYAIQSLLSWERGLK